MENDINESSPIGGALTISKDEIQEILLAIYKETGLRIGHDDPVLAVAVCSRLFIERLSGIIKLDIEACYGAWERIINESEVRHLERLNGITNAVDSIEEESRAYIQNLTELVATERRSIIEEGGRAKESFHSEAQRVLNEMKDELKKQTEGYKPLKKSTLIGFAFAGALALSITFSAGAYLYLSHKASADLEMVIKSSKQLLDFTQDTIKTLPAKQREAAKKELGRIIN